MDDPESDDNNSLGKTAVKEVLLLFLSLSLYSSSMTTTMQDGLQCVHMCPVTDILYYLHSALFNTFLNLFSYFLISSTFAKPSPLLRMSPLFVLLGHLLLRQQSKKRGDLFVVVSCVFARIGFAVFFDDVMYADNATCL